MGQPFHVTHAVMLCVVAIAQRSSAARHHPGALHQHELPRGRCTSVGLPPPPPRPFRVERVAEAHRCDVPAQAPGAGLAQAHVWKGMVPTITDCAALVRTFAPTECSHRLFALTEFGDGADGLSPSRHSLPPGAAQPDYNCGCIPPRWERHCGQPGAVLNTSQVSSLFRVVDHPPASAPAPPEPAAPPASEAAAPGTGASSRVSARPWPYTSVVGEMIARCAANTSSTPHPGWLWVRTPKCGTSTTARYLAALAATRKMRGPRVVPRGRDGTANRGGGHFKAG